MNLKLQNFINISNTIKRINNEKHSIYLIAHQSNLSTVQNNILNNYCLDCNVIVLNIKSKLFRKLTKNFLILNLFVGPTKIFIFSNVSQFLTFLANAPFSQKILPLTVYFNNQFFSYIIFKNEILKLKKEMIKPLNITKVYLLADLSIVFKIFIKKLNIAFLNFVKFLSYLKINN